MRDINLFAARFAGQPFKRGYHDCFMLCCRWLKHNGLPDPRDSFNCQYSTVAQACKRISEAGFDGAHGFFDSSLSRADCAKIGDIVELRTAHPIAGFGVMTDEGVLTVCPQNGAVLTDPSDIVRIWRVTE